MTEPTEPCSDRAGYTGLLEALPAAVYVASVARGTILYVNRAAVELVAAVSSEELVGRPLSDLTHRDSLASARERHAHLAAGGAPESGVRGKMVRLDGETILVEGSVALGRLDGELVFQAIVRDITGDASLQRDLIAQQLRMAKAERSAGFGHWHCLTPSGRVRWSEQVFRICGLEPGDVTLDPEKVLAVYHPDDRERVRELLSRCEHRGEQFSCECRVMRPDGEVRHVLLTGECDLDLDGRAHEIFGIMQDISGVARAERLLRDTFDSIRDAFALYGADDRLVLCNDAYRGSTGAQLAALTTPGLRFGDMIRAVADARLLDLDAQATERWVAERMERHRDPRGGFILGLRDGRRLEVREHRTHDGGTFVLHRDVTERERAATSLEEHREHLAELVDARTVQLREAHEELLRAERMATIGQLTGTVSHELRNPLATIRSSVYTMRRLLSHREEPQLERPLGRIERNIGRCVAIIDELLDYARARKLEFAPTCMDRWCATALEDLPAPPEVRMETDLNAGVTVNIDGERLRQALINVVQNACQAVAEHAPEPLEDDRWVRVSTRRRNDRAEVLVSDNGPGLPEEHRSRMFEPLFSTKSLGVGLGLPLVKQIMEGHGGGVDVTPGTQGGLAVCLWVPIPG